MTPHPSPASLPRSSPPVWLLRLWWAKRQTAAQRARADRAEAERDAAASERDRAQPCKRPPP